MSGSGLTQHKMSALLSCTSSLPTCSLDYMPQALVLLLQGLCVMSIIPLGVYLTFQVSAMAQYMSHKFACDSLCSLQGTFCTA